MTETLSSLIAQVKQSKYSQLLTLSEDGLANVWKQVSNFVRKQLCLQKGVGIVGLGTFTFSQELPSGANKVSRPIFILSEKFAQLHMLKMNKQHIPGHIPVVPLNFTVISNEVALRREISESAVKEVILALSHSLAANKNVEMELAGIGKLLFMDKKVQMKFYKEFISSLDSTGKMGRAFQRCNTASSDMSLMSGGPVSPRSSLEDGGACPLPSIKEHSSSSGPEPQVRPLAISKPQSGGEVSEAPPEARVENEDCLETDQKACPGSLQVETPKKVELRPSRQSSRQSLCVAKASGVFYGSEDTPKAQLECPKTPPSSNQSNRKPSMTKSTTTNPQSSSVQTTPPDKHKSPHYLDLPPLNQATPTSKRRTRSLSPAWNRKSTPLAPSQHRASVEADHVKPLSPCQDLCYICHQRAQRNVPVSFSDQIRERELEENAMWQEYDRQQRELHHAKEQAAKMRKARYAKDAASFNYQVSMTKEVQRNKQPSVFHSSYVFQHRTLTPPKWSLQQKYCSDLDTQIAISRSKEREKREFESSMDREYQQQLAKQLALSSEEFQREKVEQRALYQKALAEQIQWRQQGIEVEDQKAVQPMFAVLEPAVKDPTAQEREMTRALFLEQRAMAAEVQRIKEEKTLRTKALEAEMLMNTRKELLEDIQEAHGTREAVRKKLETKWSENVKEKQRRLEEEQQTSKDPGILLLDQCLRNKRCKQCQRRVDHMGNLRIGTTV